MVRLRIALYGIEEPIQRTLRLRGKNTKEKKPRLLRQAWSTTTHCNWLHPRRTVYRITEKISRTPMESTFTVGPVSVNNSSKMK